MQQRITEFIRVANLPSVDDWMAWQLLGKRIADQHYLRNQIMFPLVDLEQWRQMLHLSPREFYPKNGLVIPVICPFTKEFGIQKVSKDGIRFVQTESIWRLTKNSRLCAFLSCLTGDDFSSPTHRSHESKDRTNWNAKHQGLPAEMYCQRFLGRIVSPFVNGENPRVSAEYEQLRLSYIKSQTSEEELVFVDIPPARVRKASSNRPPSGDGCRVSVSAVLKPRGTEGAWWLTTVQIQAEADGSGGFIVKIADSIRNSRLLSSEDVQRIQHLIPSLPAEAEILPFRS